MKNTFQQISIHRGSQFLMSCLFAFVSSNVYAVASYNEVYDVVFSGSLRTGSEIEREEEAVYSKNELPHYSVSTSKFFLDGVNMLAKAAKRTVNEDADYLPRLEKLLHPNGICFAATWKINSKTNYSGLFATNATAPMIVRASTALTETKACEGPRAFGFAGKIFPTNDLNKPVKTLNFFTIDTLGGRDAKHFTDVVLTNEPETGGLRFDLISLGFNVLTAFKSADTNPGFRPIDHIASVGIDSTVEKVSSPKWMMIRFAADQDIPDEQDFRDELFLEAFRILVFDVLVSEKSGDRDNPKQWKKIGTITLEKSIVSYGCDRQLTFHHPKIRTN